MWTLDAALQLIREIQPQLREHNYHVTLGGGVLNNGKSDNDLDLYFLPLEDESNHPDDRKDYSPIEVMSIVHKITGAFGSHMEDYENLRTSYKQKLRYIYKDGRVLDIFVV